jgi:hypothetical protein
MRIPLLTPSLVWGRPVWRRPVWRGHSCPRNAYSRIALAGNYCRRLVLSAVLAITPYAAAQRTTSAAHTSSAHSATRHSNSSAPNFAVARSPRASTFRRSSPHVSPYNSLPFPFFGDSFNPDDIYSTGYPVASQPPPFLMEAMRQLAGPATTSMGQAMSTPANHQSSSTDPLMIELQNGRYVRVNRAAVDGEALPLMLEPNRSPTKAAPIKSAQPMITTSPSQPLTPAVLIFHDGHTEEVRDYTIADGILYARGDYYTDGYWNKKIDLATLSVGQTLQANADRNVKFVLPSAPNEVITRP